MSTPVRNEIMAMPDNDIQPSNAAPTSRYALTSGGTGRDQVLDRDIAVQSSGAADSEGLLRTARFLGKLEHPSLPCVHDFVRDDHGAQLVTRPLRGITLAAAVGQRAHGQTLDALSDPAACVLTFIHICHALSAAHAKGVVHGAIRPDTIVLGPDGTIEITGWEQAERLAERQRPIRAATPSSVPAGPPMDGLYEDIHGVGVCLFTALVGEAPPRNQSGQLAETSFAAAKVIPTALETIIRKAMASTAAEGYSAIAEVRADLQRFITGQTPYAAKPSSVAHTLHWAGEHRRALFAVTVLLAAVIGAVLLVNWNTVSTYAAWGPPLVAEDFTGDDWKTRWGTIGNWQAQNGRIITSSEKSCALVLRQRLSPPVAIEYTGTFGSAVRPGDLSIWWCEGDALSGAPEITLPGRFIQAGAKENSWCTILQTPERIRSAVTNLVLKPNVVYHFRVEIESDRLRMWIDGTKILDHHELFPIGSGTIALYSWDPGKSFDDVRIWQREVPELISPLALGDVAYRAGRYAEADTLYGRVANSHVGRPLGEQALYFQGLSQSRMGDKARSWKTWQSMPEGTLRRRAECLTIEDLVDMGEVKTASERFTTMWKERPDVRADLRQRWQIAGQHLTKVKPLPHDDLTAWIAVRDACFGDDLPSRWIVAVMLDLMKRWDEILTRFPDEKRSVGPALIALGRGAEVLAGDWATSYERVTAMVGVGDPEGALRSPDITQELKATLLCKVGRAEEAALIDPYPAMIYLGKTEERLRSNGFGIHANEALIVAGRLEEAAGAGAAGSPDSGNDAKALLLLGHLDEADAQHFGTGLSRLYADLAAGRIEQAQARRPTVIGNIDASVDSLWFASGVGLALADVALGDAAALRAAVEKGARVTGAWGGRMAVVCQAALDPAKDANVLAMPWKTEAQAWLYIAQALRGELAGDTAAAHAGWKAFSELPYLQRMLDGNCLNIEVELCAAWRLAATKP